VRAGKYPVKIQLPHVLGADPAGEVVQIGGSVTPFKVGDRVAVISATLANCAGHASGTMRPIVSTANV